MATAAVMDACVSSTLENGHKDFIAEKQHHGYNIAYQHNQ